MTQQRKNDDLKSLSLIAEALGIGMENPKPSPIAEKLAGLPTWSEIMGERAAYMDRHPGEGES